MPPPPGKARNYLSIDGGINPLSALYIINEMLQRLKFDVKSEEDLKACDWFNLITGSGHGGLIALLLGRLQMTTSQTIKAYHSLATVLVTEPTESKQEREMNGRKFMEAFENILTDAGYPVDSPMHPEAEEKDPCKVAVCTRGSLDALSCQFIRSYTPRSMSTPNCTILQAACATVASPDAYEPVVVRDEEGEMTYIDATSGYANPTNEMLKEAENVFGKDAVVATIISIGSGKSIMRQQEQGCTNVPLMNILRRVILDTERVHDDLQNRFQDLGIYYRFNADNVLPIRNRIEDTKTKSHTMTYVKEAATTQRIDQAIQSVQERSGVKTLKELNSIPVVEMRYRQRPSVVPFFVGRQDILGQLHETHAQKPSPEGDYPIISVLTGLGGSGKTQVALQFTKQVETRIPDLLVFFVDASSADRIKEDYQAIIRSRSIAHRSSTWEHALQWLATTDTPWLIIADNADDPSMDLHPFVPRSHRNHFIITSRNVNRALMARTRAHAHHVQELATDDSVDLLLKVSGYDPTDVNGEHAMAIVKALGHLPLATVQAAGYIHNHKCLSSYLKLFNESREKLLAQKVMELPHGYNLSVATTLEMSFNKLPLQSKQALCIFSHLHNTSISHKIIETAAWNKFFYAAGKASDADMEKLNQIRAESDALLKIFCPGERWSDVEFHGIIEPCLQYSLLQTTTSENDQRFYSMHILVQSWLQIQPTPTGQHSPSSLARRMLLAVVQEGSPYQHFELHQMLRPHFGAFSGQPLDIATDNALGFHVLRDTGSYAASMIHMEAYMALVNRKMKILGPEHPDTLASMNSLAWSYKRLGEYRKSRELNEETLALRKKTLGPKHPGTLSSMSNLALDYSNLGEHEKSRGLNEEILALSRDLLGPEHPDTLIYMGHLAWNYVDLGEYDKAQKLGQELLELCQKVTGLEHPQTLVAMSLLAMSSRPLGQYEKARNLIEEVLVIRTRALGSEHPETLTSLENLALIHTDLGEHKKARELYKQILALRKKILGPEHRDTLVSMSNLALHHSSLGEYEEARDLDEETLSLRRRVLGPEHSDTL
ncbi:hypothetical protein CPB86DRAFT_729099, partial [Serendipita vermifera]